MPRQLTVRGHRLVFSNGIIGLAAASTVLVVLFKADVSKLIPFYAIGVFTSFTLSQAGMAKRHLRLREPGWRVGLVINGLGAITTARRDGRHRGHEVHARRVGGHGLRSGDGLAARAHEPPVRARGHASSRGTWSGSTPWSTPPSGHDPGRRSRPQDRCTRSSTRRPSARTTSRPSTSRTTRETRARSRRRGQLGGSASTESFRSPAGHGEGRRLAGFVAGPARRTATT